MHLEGLYVVVLKTILAMYAFGGTLYMVLLPIFMLCCFTFFL